MKDKISIIQFMPYFPPHKWWVETVWEEIWKYWIKNKLWNLINIVTEFDQRKFIKNDNIIFYKWEEIWYYNDWYEILVVPSIEIINNFPVYKIWSKKYKLIIEYLLWKISTEYNSFRVITHTRFFLTSLIWWLFAFNNNIKWVHIEHWSDYVKLSSKIKSYISFVYDKIIWNWIFQKADIVLAISNACKEFINRDFTNRNINIFYRWIDFSNNIIETEILSKKFRWKKIIWYIWRLYKWKNVESLINAYYLLDDNIKNNYQLVIVWDWEDFKRLKKMNIDNSIYFTWWKSFWEALSYQKQFDIHVHPSSPWGWLATTILQAMNLWCMIVATPNEGAREVIIDNKNWFLLKNDSIEEINRWINRAILNLGSSENFKKENKKNIEEKFSWKNNIFTLYNLIK